MYTANCPSVSSLFLSGATTGTGARIRNIHAVVRGGHCIADIAGYCFDKSTDDR
jgi:hypothetical protein